MISADFSALKKTKWYEYVVRFVLGGALTVIAGLLAKPYGPAFGGLFLAFPAIFPASATLIEKHERQKKRRAGIFKTTRGTQAAALDAAGAVLGTVGLVAFAVVVWKLLPVWSAPVALLAAVGSWLTVSTTLWWISTKY